MKYSLQLTLKTLTQYEKVSGQLINKSKSCFSMSPRTAQSSITGVCNSRHDHFPMKYLGFPLHPGRKKLTFYFDVVSKVINNIRGWHLKFLSFGGRATLIRHALLALNIHRLAAIHPPKALLI